MATGGYFDLVVTCILGDYTFEINPSSYDPGYKKLATESRTKDGTLIVQAVVDENSLVRVKHDISIQGLDQDQKDSIDAEFRKANFIYFRSPLGDEFDGSGTAGHFNKVWFKEWTSPFTSDLHKVQYTLKLMEQ